MKLFVTLTGIYLIVVVCCFGSWRPSAWAAGSQQPPSQHQLIDMRSFLVKAKALELATMGTAYADDYDFNRCVQYLQASFRLLPLSITATYLGKCYELAFVEENDGAEDIDPIVGTELQDADKGSLKAAYLRHAQSYYQQAYDLDQHHDNTHLFRILAGNHYVIKDYAGAIYFHEQALRVNASLVHSWWELGVVRQATGDIEAAARAYYNCNQLDPHLHSCRLNLATLHHSFGDVLSAVDFYKETVKLCEQTRYHVDDNSHPQQQLPRVKVIMCSEYRKSSGNLASAYFQLGYITLVSFRKSSGSTGDTTVKYFVWFAGSKAVGSVYIRTQLPTEYSAVRYRKSPSNILCVSARFRYGQ
jgi:tetratricopeptide (TPR) repeat protein